MISSLYKVFITKTDIVLLVGSNWNNSSNAGTFYSNLLKLMKKEGYY